MADEKTALVEEDAPPPPDLKTVSKRRQSVKHQEILQQGPAAYSSHVQQAMDQLLSEYSVEEYAKLKEAELIKQRASMKNGGMHVFPGILRERSGSTPASPGRTSSMGGGDDNDFTSGRMAGKDLAAGLTDTDRKLIFGILNGQIDFLKEEQRDHVKMVFQTLDTNKDDVLSANDFQHSLPGADGYLRLMWERIQYLFDFQQQGSVSIDDFCAYFIIAALNKANNDTSMVGLPLGVQLERMQEIFQQNFDEQLEDIYAHILASNTGTFSESSGKY